MAFKLFNRNPDQPEMSFVDHLEELRWHIVRSLLAVIVIAIVIFVKIDWIFDNVFAGPIHSNFVSYTALCKFGRAIHIGDALCMQSVDSLRLQTTTFGSQFLSSIT